MKSQDGDQVYTADFVAQLNKDHADAVTALAVQLDQVQRRAHAAEINLNTLRETRAALEQLMEQVEQMKGMFPDGDGAIRNALADAEAALAMWHEFRASVDPNDQGCCATCGNSREAHGETAPTLSEAAKLSRDLSVRMGATPTTHGKVVIHNLANSEDFAGFDLVSFGVADIPAVIAALSALQEKGGA